MIAFTDDKGRKIKVNLFWFRRDLRFHDNTALMAAQEAGIPVVCLFIFDSQILNRLKENDPRVRFIYHRLLALNHILRKRHSSILIKCGKPSDILQELLIHNNVEAIFANEDYEPYGITRDAEIEKFCEQKGVCFKLYKDQVIFAKDEIVKKDGLPYTVYTPYKKKWWQKYEEQQPISPVSSGINTFNGQFEFPSLSDIGFIDEGHTAPDYQLEAIKEYHLFRDYPYKNSTTYLGIHLRFGTVSIREMARLGHMHNPVFLSELIWREFFMQILYHFPSVVDHNFKQAYDFIPWRNDEVDFEKWCRGLTGFPMVDAGMRELNQTGYMHNRVRMITAGFLCKHLLIDWRWGEAYFASKLLDYELSSNNGNWQWAAGTGCDAAPYFRVFNPMRQQERFDPDFDYVKKWIPEFGTNKYPKPMVDHQFARERAIRVYKEGIRK